jgi:hypothetical protein
LVNGTYIENEEQDPAPAISTLWASTIYRNSAHLTTLMRHDAEIAKMDYMNDDILKKGDATLPGPANNEIWYTSSDGNIVAPNDPGVLPTIVSNTYADGKGIIKFASIITSIGRKAFSGCTKLTSISMPSTVMSLEYNAFKSCTGLTSVTILIKVIGNYAFENCTGLTSVTIVNGVESIGEGAFIGCRYLTTISYTGTIAQWNTITKRNYWHNSVPATVVHCTDGDARI